MYKNLKLYESFCLRYIRKVKFINFVFVRKFISLLKIYMFYYYFFYK